MNTVEKYLQELGEKGYQIVWRNDLRKIYMPYEIVYLQNWRKNKSLSISIDDADNIKPGAEFVIEQYKRYSEIGIMLNKLIRQEAKTINQA